MSGISEVKKKTKIAIDEMYDNQLVGKLDIQKEGKQESQESSQHEKQPYLQQNTNTPSQEKFEPTSIEELKQVLSFPTIKQQSQKTPTFKMTFNLPEDIYKAFNDLYANRMLQGRKTEKSEMICEAIHWLIKKEQEFNL